MRGGRHFDRLVGRYATGRSGPGVVITGGLHGNEPAGVLAAERVIARLEQERCPLRGELVALAGNLPALASGVRFIDYDLNRCWLEEAIRSPQGGTEDAELAALIASLEAVPAPLVVVDLHTTSAESPPFTLMSDVRRNRKVAFALPVPVILGLEETVDGTLLEYMTELGHTAIVVETGLHDDPAAVDLHEAVIWLTLEATGALKRREIPDYDSWREQLARPARGLPRVLEVRHCHEIKPGDGFEMEPGHRGFEEIEEGQRLAQDRHGEIEAPEPGLLLMPLYQEQGDDGFFVVRKVSRFWLWLSVLVRVLRMDKLLPLLPGVSRHATLPHSLLVDPDVARVRVKEIFHLFGFRKRRPEGDMLVFSRRRPG